MAENKGKSWAEMSPDEKADFLRQEDLRLYDTIIAETRRLAELIGQQSRRIDKLKKGSSGNRVGDLGRS